ncbi:MAG: quinoprotein relay system zinc metallohydrolase 2 [Hyphomicrobiaceae bacterium]|nr:quinoprotein relay system zinc metallohydrolase 2 [Hyphomicrobiaceae bacterium]
MAEAPTGTAASGDGRPREIGSGVFVHRGQLGVYTPGNGGDICNTGFVIGADAVAVIDTGGTAAVGRALRDHIRSLTDRPIRYVINTHMHPDHVLGNAAFKADNPAFVGHGKLGAALTARAERYLAFNMQAVGAEAFEGTEIIVPTVAVASSQSIELGGRRLTLTARPTAHTDNDLTIHDSATDILFTGDLIFSGHVPTLDGSIRGWLALLDTLAGQSVKQIVPGHGPAAMPWPDAARPVQRYLGAVAGGVRAAIREGRTMSDAIATVAREEQDQWELFDEFHGRNISAAFAELEWE